MTRRHFLSHASSLTALLFLGHATQGCNHKSGRQLGAGSSTSADLEVANASQNTLHVYLDGGEIGEVPPAGNGKFQVLSGSHKVEVRERGHTTRHSFGQLLFGFSPIKVTYRP